MSIVLGRLGRDPSATVTADYGLFDELGFDSFELLNVIVVAEELADVLVPPADIPDMLTAGSLYAYYQQLLSAPD